VVEIDVYLIPPIPEILVTGTTINLPAAGGSDKEVIDTLFAFQIIAQDAAPLLSAFVVIALLVLVK
jgi:S-adenosylhomocysteine hydrolase